MNELEEQWKPFTATQLVITQRLGFDWDACIQMTPGLNAFVHDTYLLGKGSLQASLLGLFILAKMSDAPEMNQGELLRFFAETPWYPTALLPSQGVRWEAIDDNSARATLTDGATTASVVFQFNAEGAIATFWAEARYRATHGYALGRKLAGLFSSRWAVARGAIAPLTAMPWGGSLRDYSVRDGMLIPLDGEVGWEYPEGTRLYFKGQITEISYEFAS
jgi:hypothetical protein